MTPRTASARHAINAAVAAMSALLAGAHRSKCPTKSNSCKTTTVPFAKAASTACVKKSELKKQIVGAIMGDICLRELARFAAMIAFCVAMCALTVALGA
jgi:hypothetical protein